MGKIIKCKRCGKRFDFDKTYGLCPKCGLSNAGSLNSYYEEDVYKDNDLEFRDEYHDHNEPLFDNSRPTINGQDITNFNDSMDTNDLKNQLLSNGKKILNDIKEEQDEEKKKGKVLVLILALYFGFQMVMFFIGIIFDIIGEIFSLFI